ncbi:unnamed protein product [Lactuca saligna]|uniref:DUF4283 domain-containing protein n=1 Tax=Lactuca saligna TaxID=75948 RepID=A0AA35UXM5_LACSI|nr:unnamed protein product [Lactuca saligna]
MVHQDASVKSYANVIRGLVNDISSIKKVEAIIELTSWDFKVEKRQWAFLVKARDFSTLPNLRVLCLGKGIEKIELRYAGGLWFLIEFTSTNACKNFMVSATMDHWIFEKHVWD